MPFDVDLADDFAQDAKVATTSAGCSDYRLFPTRFLLGNATQFLAVQFKVCLLYTSDAADE